MFANDRDASAVSSIVVGIFVLERRGGFYQGRILPLVLVVIGCCEVTGSATRMDGFQTEHQMETDVNMKRKLGLRRGLQGLVDAQRNPPLEFLILPAAP